MEQIPRSQILREGAEPAAHEVPRGVACPLPRRRTADEQLAPVLALAVVGGRAAVRAELRGALSGRREREGQQVGCGAHDTRRGSARV